MNRFVIFSFLVMGVAYYELSGGADFVPESARIEATAEAPAPEIEVTRAATPETLVDLVAAEPADIVAAVPLADLPAPAAIEPSIEAALSTALQEQGGTVVAATPVNFNAQPEEAPLAPGLSPTGDIRVVTGSRVNLREGPGTSHGVISQLTEGTVTEVMEQGSGSWVRVRTEGGTLMGWMSADYLAPASDG